MNEESFKEKYSIEISALSSYDQAVVTGMVDIVLDFLSKSLNSQDFQSKLGELMSKSK